MCLDMTLKSIIRVISVRLIIIYRRLVLLSVHHEVLVCSQHEWVSVHQSQVLVHTWHCLESALGVLWNLIWKLNGLKSQI